MVSICEVSKAYAGCTLFAEASLHIGDHDRIGLVGPNGAGKSTLFSLILGAQAPDTGQVLCSPRISIGHLPQETAPVGDETVVALAATVTAELAHLRRQMRALERGDDAAAEADAHRRFEHLGGPRLEAAAKRILAGLGFRPGDFDRPTRELSGGWVMRAHLARLLVQQPDLLLLDEPTNHLDLDTLLWFQDYLRNYPGALLIISHDRSFLNALVESIVEIRQARLWTYRGNYDQYLAQREANEQQWLAAWKNQQREIARLMEFVNRFRAKNTKASQAQSKLKQIDRMERVEAPAPDEREISFQFPQPPRSGLRVIRLQHVSHAYGGNVVYRDLNFEAERGQRIVLVGPNGAGKSTLLKLVAGALPVQSGSRELGYNVRAGYYAQYRDEMLHPESSVLEEALETPQRVTETFVRTLLGCFLFQGDDVFKRVSVLSGGEKSRLSLVKLLLDPPNLLLMDEPTTHLDLASIDALAYALDQFQGTLIFISHDVYFIRALANHVVHVESGVLRHYPGGYDYYLDRTGARDAAAPLPGVSPAPRFEMGAATGSAAEQRRAQKRAEAEWRNARARARREQQQVVEQLEARIHALEQRQADITAALQAPETYNEAGRAAQLNREYAANRAALATLTPQWESEATQLAKIDAVKR